MPKKILIMNNNVISNSKNQRFSKVREELKRLLSIIIYSVENNNEDSFDYIISNSNNPEDIKIAQFLKQDELNRANRIKHQDKLDKESKKAQKNSTEENVVVQKCQKSPLSNTSIVKKTENNRTIHNDENDLEL